MSFHLKSIPGKVWIKLVYIETFIFFKDFIYMRERERGHDEGEGLSRGSSRFLA